MSENTKIEWCDHTFNPWEGCTKVGPGCDHCYAETRNARFGGGVAVNWGPGAPRRRTSSNNWNKPRAWNAAHAEFFAQHGRRQRVFCASLADVFDNAVNPSWRADLFDLIDATPALDWLLLTKRIGNAWKMMANACGVSQLSARLPLPNVWLGATITSQEEADRDILKLLAVPATRRFLSMEPLLGPVSFEGLFANPANPADGTNALEALDWVIVGGESGPGARPMHPDWARSLRDQCQAAGTPFLFKQWGEHDLSYDRDRDDPDYRRCATIGRQPGRWINLKGGHGFNGERVHYAHRVGKKAAGRLLDGRIWDEFPRVATCHPVTMYYGSPDCKSHAFPLSGRTEIEG
ncbi:phage Gp37/Gp68 family protein [Alicycliphilus denitrificans]|uniref:phage Gp37/Gp68 family protein n=1 Tax=Alicycliphilus denitrificans TaxID=179636 RepID=UPI0001DA0DFD|nr:phage Gp37/Gp68 family protein [Alicycliphilus denitrificans]ADV01305.1 Gp37Gp68 family protein [Alicycliphilus denitrificans BC]